MQGGWYCPYTCDSYTHYLNGQWCIWFIPHNLRTPISGGLYQAAGKGVHSISIIHLAAYKNSLGQDFNLASKYHLEKG